MAYGQWHPEPMVDAAPAAEHIRALVADGRSSRRIAEAADVSPSLIRRLLWPDRARPAQRRIKARDAESLLAVKPDMVDETYVDSIGPRRMVEGLCRIGYTKTELSIRCGKNGPALDNAIRHRRITIAWAQRIRDLYAELYMTPAPDSVISRRSRAYAAKQGWYAPLTWDDDTINDPSAMPEDGQTDGAAFIVDLVAVRRVILGEGKWRDLTRPEQSAVCGLMNEEGWTASRMYRRLHQSQETIRDRLSSWPAVKAHLDGR